MTEKNTQPQEKPKRYASAIGPDEYGRWRGCVVNPSAPRDTPPHVVTEPCANRDDAVKAAELHLKTYG